ncbi:P-loop containing nucleoside triphosphate hydrolase protein [Jimgerdemannia flammicorona]|uniref:ATP-dependent RNA helicase n=1 Tax=Jimgerdemannia flammicorona TaxID=994334 RepID=A0A433QKI6_9FUNG|nr:P-loop containing nucleoside triphosphate hydrolase protein [Jimgerdemannia flammicorona]
MDDDGLIMNFAPSSGVGSTYRSVKPALKKGSWKQRLRVKKNIQRKERKLAAVQDSARTVLNSEFVSAGGRRTSDVREKQSDHPVGTATPATKVMHGKPQVISSLFSYNPEIRKKDPAVKDATKKKSLSAPSNAPVSDTTTFQGIGIDSDLVAHMTDKLGAQKPTQIQRRAIPILLGPSRRQVVIDDIEVPDEDVDAVVQAETGSGKTLTYLLPIVNRLILSSTTDASSTNASSTSAKRSVGTLAIVLTPTRELAQQVLGVLQTLLSLPPCGTTGRRRSHWIVPGVVIGGDKKKSEKARLRKGVNVLVSTPGRLLDHLQNTKSFEIENLRWLVLDEADRLLDLGFEETLRSIVTILDERTAGRGRGTRHEDSDLWPGTRQTVLCSATLREDVRRLAGTSLRNPVFIRGQGEEGVASVKRLHDRSDTAGKKGREDVNAMDVDDAPEAKFSTPNQLKQTYVLTPAKLRLVALAAMLRSCFVTRQSGMESKVDNKVVVFFSCCDSVDFHHDLFANAGKAQRKRWAGDSYEEEEDGENEEDEGEEESPEHRVLREVLKAQKDEPTAQNSNGKKVDQPDAQLPPKPFAIGTVLPDVPLYRLHGELAQSIRTQVYLDFRKAATGVLFCTDVAARGLDLPDVTRIIQYDAPADLKDYVHRVGRTARLGRQGQATLFLLPSEMEYLDVLKAQELKPEPVKVESVLMGLVSEANGKDFQTPATELQNTFERYVLADEKRMTLTRNAYWSSVRAYATHSAAEKHIFHIKKLHLGHLAKAFALREAPSNMHATQSRKKQHWEKRDEEKDGGKGGKAPKKRKLDPSAEFAIGDLGKMVGPTTRKKTRK